MTDASLHPSLHKLSTTPRQILRLAGFLTFITAAGVMLYMMATAMTSGNITSIMQLGLVGLVMFPLILSMGFLLRYLDRWLSQQLDTANQLLREQTPISARLTPTGIKNKQGVLMALQPFDNKLSLTEPLFALINPSFRWSHPPKQETNIQLYCVELNTGNDIVALPADGNTLLGKLVTWRDYEKWMQKMLLMAAIFLVIAMSVLAYMAFKEHRIYQNSQQELHWAEQSADWLKTSGTIRQAELSATKISKDKLWVVGYQAQLKFEYTAADSLQQGNTLFFCYRPTEDRQAAESFLAKYPIDKSVTVHYDPADATRSVLETGHIADCESVVDSARMNLLFTGGLAGFFLLIVLAVVWDLQKQRKLGLAIQGDLPKSGR